jgi:hypothetical protein
VIDAAVNGGVNNYKEAFFSEKFLAENRDKASHVAKLKELLNNQLEIVEGSLQLHEKLCPPQLTDLQQTLNSQFESMKNTIQV